MAGAKDAVGAVIHGNAPQYGLIQRRCDRYLLRAEPPQRIGGVCIARLFVA
jgi:hypothetical protein